MCYWATFLVNYKFETRVKIVVAGLINVRSLADYIWLHHRRLSDGLWLLKLWSFFSDPLAKSYRRFHIFLVVRFLLQRLLLNNWQKSLRKNELVAVLCWRWEVDLFWDMFKHGSSPVLQYPKLIKLLLEFLVEINLFVKKRTQHRKNSFNFACSHYFDEVHWPDQDSFEAMICESPHIDT